MNLLTAFLLCGAIWIVVRWVFPIGAKQRLMKGRPAEAIAAGGELAMFGVIALVAFAAFVACGGLLAALAVIKAGSADSMETARALLDKLQGWSRVVQNLGGAWAWICGIVLSIGAVIYFKRAGKARAQADLQNKANVESAEVIRRAREGTLEDLPPDEEMGKMLALGRQLQEERERRVHAKRPGAEIEEIENMLEQVSQELARLDITRRMDLSMSESDLRLEAPDTLMGKIGTFFISPGLGRLLTRGSRLAIGGVTIAALLCAVGIQSGAVRETLDAKIKDTGLAFERFKFGGAADRAAAELEQALAAVPAAAEPLKVEEQEEADDVASTIAVAYEQRLISYLAGGKRVTPDLGSTRAVRANVVREGILSAHARVAPAAEYVPSSFGEMHGPAADAVRASMAPDLKPKPATEAGRRVAENARKVMKKGGRSIMERFRQGVATFQIPVRLGTPEQIFVSEFAGSMMDAKSAERFNFERTLSPELRTAMARGQSGRADAFMAKFMAQGDLAQAFDVVMPETSMGEGFHPPRDMDAIRSVVEPETTRLMRAQSLDIDRAPTLRPKAGAYVNTDAASRSLSQLYVRAGGGEQMAQTLDAMADYQDYFPGQVGEENLSAQGKLRQQLESQTHLAQVMEDTNRGLQPPPDAPSSGGGGGGGGGGGSKSSKVASGRTASAPQTLRSSTRSSSLVSASRARSFRMSRGFARVGGVLIGQDPDKSDAKVSVAALDWQITPEKKIILTARGQVNGAEKTWTSAPLDADAVYAGLVYAADGRVTAVTMVRANPLSELKILAHPALLDSRVGQAVIDLDRFVDTYAADKDRAQAEGLVQSAHELYELAWAARASVLESNRDTILKIFKDGEQVGQLLDRINAMVMDARASAGLDGDKSDADKKAAARFAMVKVAGLEKKTPLKKKSEFYDPVLVSAMEEALKSANTIEEFWSKLSAAFQSSIRSSAPSGLGGLVIPGQRTPRITGLDQFMDKNQRAAESVDPEKLADLVKSSLLPAPEFQIWSGVREAEYLVDGQALLPAAGDQPFRFMLQVAFTSPPQFGEEKARGEDYSDESPWEFPTLEATIKKEVSEGVAKDSEASGTLRVSSEFALMQRFFRLALDGHLGDDFPLPRLQELSAALQPLLPPPQRTPRWNSRRGSLESVLLQLARKAKTMIDATAQPDVAQLFDEAATRLSAAVKGEEDFLGVCLDLLAAADRDTPTWTQRWDAAWEKEEARRKAWEDEWAVFFRPLQRLALPGDAAVQPALQRLLVYMDTQATGIRVRRELGVHVDDKQQRQHISAKDALASQAERRAAGDLLQRLQREVRSPNPQ